MDVCFVPRGEMPASPSDPSSPRFSIIWPYGGSLKAASHCISSLETRPSADFELLLHEAESSCAGEEEQKALKVRQPRRQRRQERGCVEPGDADRPPVSDGTDLLLGGPGQRRCAQWCLHVLDLLLHIVNLIRIFILNLVNGLSLFIAQAQLAIVLWQHTLRFAFFLFRTAAAS